MKFEVEIVETLSKKIVVEAKSVDEAEEIAEEMHSNSKIILTADDFEDVDFYGREL